MLTKAKMKIRLARMKSIDRRLSRLSKKDACSAEGAMEITAIAEDILSAAKILAEDKRMDAVKGVDNDRIKYLSCRVILSWLIYESVCKGDTMSFALLLDLLDYTDNIKIACMSWARMEEITGNASDKGNTLRCLRYTIANMKTSYYSNYMLRCLCPYIGCLNKEYRPHTSRLISAVRGYEAAMERFMADMEGSRAVPTGDEEDQPEYTDGKQDAESLEYGNKVTASMLPQGGVTFCIKGEKADD